jgi:hypothetical protein
MLDEGGLQRELEEAAEGLVYSSESDFPFAYFRSLESTGVVTIESVRSLLGIPASIPIRERTLDRFLAHHTYASDPYDRRAQAIRPRYEALQGILERELRDVRAFLIGTIELRCYVVGVDGAGHLTGLMTTAIET